MFKMPKENKSGQLITTFFTNKELFTQGMIDLAKKVIIENLRNEKITDDEIQELKNFLSNDNHVELDDIILEARNIIENPPSYSNSFDDKYSQTIDPKVHLVIVEQSKHQSEQIIGNTVIEGRSRFASITSTTSTENGFDENSQWIDSSRENSRPSSPILNENKQDLFSKKFELLLRAIELINNYKDLCSLIPKQKNYSDEQSTNYLNEVQNDCENITSEIIKSIDNFSEEQIDSCTAESILLTNFDLLVARKRGLR